MVAAACSPSPAVPDSVPVPPAGVARDVAVAGGSLHAQRAVAPGLVYFSRTSPTRGVEPASRPSVVGPADGMRLASLRRAVKASARAVQEVALAGSGRTVPWLVTLTYADVDGWGRRH